MLFCFGVNRLFSCFFIATEVVSMIDRYYLCCLSRQSGQKSPVIKSRNIKFSRLIVQVAVQLHCCKGHNESHTQQKNIFTLLIHSATGCCLKRSVALVLQILNFCFLVFLIKQFMFFLFFFVLMFFISSENFLLSFEEHFCFFFAFFLFSSGLNVRRLN